MITMPAWQQTCMYQSTVYWSEHVLHLFFIQFKFKYKKLIIWHIWQSIKNPFFFKMVKIKCRILQLPLFSPVWIVYPGTFTIIMIYPDIRGVNQISPRNHYRPILSVRRYRIACIIYKWLLNNLWCISQYGNWQCELIRRSL